MAHFTSTSALNMTHAGYYFVGPAGTVFWIPDSMVDSFIIDPGPIIPGLTWVDTIDATDGSTITDDTIDLDAKAQDNSMTGDDKIKDQSITGYDKIKAETIDFEQLGKSARDVIVALFPNHRFRDGTPGSLSLGANRDDPAGLSDALPYWNRWHDTGAATIDLTASTAYPGGNFLSFKPVANGTASTNNACVTSSQKIPVVPGLNYYAVCIAGGNIPVSSSIQLRLKILWYGPDDSYLSSMAVVFGWNEGELSVPVADVGGWIFTAPVNAASCRGEVIVWTTEYQAGVELRLGAFGLISPLPRDQWVPGHLQVMGGLDVGGGTAGNGINAGDHIDLSTSDEDTSAGRITLDGSAYPGTQVWFGLRMGDGTYAKPITPAGWTPFAYPVGLSPNDVYNAGHGLAAVSGGNGGADLIPLWLPAPMRLYSLTLYGADTSLARTAEWSIYGDWLEDGILGQIAGATGTFSFTPGGAVGPQTSVAATPGTLLPPGLIYLVIRNTSTARTFGLGYTAGYQLSKTGAMTSATVAALGATLDVTGWSAYGPRSAIVRLNGLTLGMAADW